jgi:hypothetical protein
MPFTAAFHAHARAHNLRYSARISAQVKHHTFHESFVGQQAPAGLAPPATIKPSRAPYILYIYGMCVLCAPFHPPTHTHINGIQICMACAYTRQLDTRLQPLKLKHYV